MYLAQLNGFLFQATDVKKSEIDFNPEFITSMVSRLDYTALKKAVEMVNEVV